MKYFGYVERSDDLRYETCLTTLRLSYCCDVIYERMSLIECIEHVPSGTEIDICDFKAVIHDYPHLLKVLDALKKNKVKIPVIERSCYVADISHYDALFHAGTDEIKQRRESYLSVWAEEHNARL